MHTISNTHSKKKHKIVCPSYSPLFLLVCTIITGSSNYLIRITFLLSLLSFHHPRAFTKCKLLRSVSCHTERDQTACVTFQLCFYGDVIICIKLVKKFVIEGNCMQSPHDNNLYTLHVHVHL